MAPRPSSQSEPSPRRMTTKCSNLSESPIPLALSQSAQAACTTEACLYSIGLDSSHLSLGISQGDAPKQLCSRLRRTPGKNCLKRVRKLSDPRSIPADGTRNCCRTQSRWPAGREQGSFVHLTSRALLCSTVVAGGEYSPKRSSSFGRNAGLRSNFRGAPPQSSDSWPPASGCNLPPSSHIPQARGLQSS